MTKNFSELDSRTQSFVGKLMTPEVYNKSFATLDEGVYESFLKEITHGKVTRKELIVYGIIRPTGDELLEGNYSKKLAMYVRGEEGVEIGKHVGEELSEDVGNVIRGMLEERNITVEEDIREGLENLYLNSVMYTIQHYRSS